MHVEEAYATWHCSIILISLRVEVAQISDFLVHAKILPHQKHFFNLYLPHSTLDKKNKALIFYIQPAMACSEVKHFYKLLGRIIFRIFSSQCHN